MDGPRRHSPSVAGWQTAVDAPGRSQSGYGSVDLSPRSGVIVRLCPANVGSRRVVVPNTCPTLAAYIIAAATSERLAQMLSEALILGKVRRSVLVIDSGQQRDASAEHMHGCQSRDGMPPGALLAIGGRRCVPTATRWSRVRRSRRGRIPTCHCDAGRRRRGAHPRMSRLVAFSLDTEAGGDIARGAAPGLRPPSYAVVPRGRGLSWGASKGFVYLS